MFSTKKLGGEECRTPTCGTACHVAHTVRTWGSSAECIWYYDDWPALEPGCGLLGTEEFLAGHKDTNYPGVFVT